MAAGSGGRWKVERGMQVWNNYLGVPKQLIEIGGEPLVKRTERLLKANNISDISITVNRLNQYGELDIPEIVNAGTYEIDRFYPVEGPVIYLYGDVYYTENAMKTITSTDSNFFGRMENSITGKPHPELFAVKGDGTLIQKHIKEVKTLFDEKKIDRCIGWELYQVFHGIDWSFLTIINDITDDFDCPSEYHAFMNAYNHHIMPRIMPILP